MRAVDLPRKSKRPATSMDHAFLVIAVVFTRLYEQSRWDFGEHVYIAASQSCARELWQFNFDSQCENLSARALPIGANVNA